MTRILNALKQLGSPAGATPSANSPEPSTENDDAKIAIASQLEQMLNPAPSEVADECEDQVLANDPESTSIVSICGKLVWRRRAVPGA